MAEQPVVDPINSLLAEFGTRLNEVEEKQRLVRDRSLLIGENLITSKEEYENQNSEIKKHMSLMKQEVKTIKQLVHRIVNELPNLARKSELEILENQSKMFQPLELARIKDVEIIIDRKLKTREKKKYGLR